MRRILTTLMILLVVIVAGLTALVLLINPNDFRAYMVQKVAERNGYQLVLEGPLRWHVWPQLSILSGRMSLTAPGATEPVVRADNMRLDVALIPLISHQLQVKQVMLKGAVIQLTPESEAINRQSAPVVPHDSMLPRFLASSHWSYDVQRLQLANSVLIFQHPDGEQLTIRDIQLKMAQDNQYRTALDFSGHINRNQRDLAFSCSANVQGADYPHSFKADISQLEWQLKGVELPVAGVSGQANGQLSWQGDQKKFSVDNFSLTANDSLIDGNFSVTTGGSAQWLLNLHAKTLNLENLLSTDVTPDSIALPADTAGGGRLRPVIADSDRKNDYDTLRAFNGHLTLTADELQWRGMKFSQLKSEFINQQGVLTVKQLQGELANGKLSLPGTFDVRGETPRAVFQPELHDVEIATLLNAFNYPLNVNGQLSLSGTFSGEKIDADDFRRHWQGNAGIQLQNTQTEGINFQQLIQQAIARNSDIEAGESDDNATRLDNLRGELKLASGELTLQNLTGHSALLALTGQGYLNLAQQLCDMQFNVRVVEGWKGDDKLINTFKQTTVPLRIYGPWDQLNYSLPVDQILRKQLQDEARQRVNDWMERNKNTQDDKSLK